MKKMLSIAICGGLLSLCSFDSEPLNLEEKSFESFIEFKDIEDIDFNTVDLYLSMTVLEYSERFDSQYIGTGKGFDMHQKDEYSVSVNLKYKPFKPRLFRGGKLIIYSLNS